MFLGFGLIQILGTLTRAHEVTAHQYQLKKLVTSDCFATRVHHDYAMKMKVKLPTIIENNIRLGDCGSQESCNHRFE